MRERGSAADRRIVATLCFVGVTAAFMQTLTLPQLPRFPDLLDTTPQNASWIITATLLSGAVSAPISGRAADLYGARRVTLMLIGLMVSGSFLSATATTLVQMVAGRALQGLLLGSIPIGMSIMKEVLPARRLPRAIATLSATLGVGGALGLPLSAVLSGVMGWRPLFVLVGCLGLVAALACGSVLPEPKHRVAEPMDLIGGAALAAGLTCVFLSMQKYVDGTWPVSVSTAVGLTGVAVLGGWACYELRIPSPLVDLRVDLRGRLLSVNTAAAATGFGLSSMGLVMPIVLRAPTDGSVGFGMTLMTASLCLMPTGLFMMLSAPMTARVIHRHGAHRGLVLGLILILCGNLFAAVSFDHLATLMMATSMVGLGIGSAYASLPALVMAEVKVGRTASANSVNVLARAAGSSFGSAVVGTAVAHGALLVDGLVSPTFIATRTALLIGACVAAIGLAAAIRVEHTGGLNR
jgi:MFS family permease